MAKIVFLGDSITLGVREGVEANEIFSYLIGNARGFTNIINAGVSNDKSADALARLSTDVLSHNPDFCVIMLGTNDVYYDVSVAQYTTNMESIITTLQNNSIQPVLFSPPLGRSTPQIDKFPDYLIALENIAYAQDVPHIDFYRHFCHLYFYKSYSEFDGYYTDWAHLSADGHAMITEIFLHDINNDVLVP